MTQVPTSIILKAQAFIKDMFGNIMLIYGEKGIEPFRKPLIIAFPALLIIYVAVYGPITKKLSNSATSLRNLEIVAQHSEEYTNAKTSLSAFQRRLPLAKDKDEWLNYIITSTAKSYGIAFDGVSSQKESEVGGFLVVSREVTVSTTYDKMGRWIAEIENSKIFLKVVDLNIRRDENSPGTVKASFRLSTVIPRFGGGGGPAQ